MLLCTCWCCTSRYVCQHTHTVSPLEACRPACDHNCCCCCLQAASFQAGEVVATLKTALLPDSGSPYVTFSSADQVLAFLGNKFVRPVYQDAVCGDGRCEVPWEGPAWGPFGCQADCGLNPNTTKVVVTLSADFTGHPSISPGALRAQVRWNLCMRDELRQTRGLPPLCW